MATQSGRTDPSLKDELFNRGYRFDFFQAVRLLARLYPDRQAVGRNASPSDEVVRLRSQLSLAFPPSAVAEIRTDQPGHGPVDMIVAFMGLTGPMGVLPRHYTELLLERVHANDYALRDFLDLFNHRLISLFYRAWEKHQCVIGYEQALIGRQPDRFAQLLFSLMGLGTEGVRARLGDTDNRVLRYAGLLGQRPRSATALQRCLSDYFEVPVTMKQFIGMSLPLQEEEWTRLGSTGANNILGHTALIGTTVWDQQAKFEIRVGPLEFGGFTRLLPSGTAYSRFTQFTKLFAGPELDFSVNLVLKGEQVPECRLADTPQYAPRLGWTTWLKTQERVRDADDVVFGGSGAVALAGTA